MSDDYINKIISINLETLIKKEDVIAVDTIKPQIHKNLFALSSLTLSEWEQLYYIINKKNV